jgi:hypothetical protein
LRTFFSGTGSYFGLNKGLHVSIRFVVNKDALAKLKRSKAVTA